MVDYSPGDVGRSRISSDVVALVPRRHADKCLSRTRKPRLPPRTITNPVAGGAGDEGPHGAICGAVAVDARPYSSFTITISLQPQSPHLYRESTAESVLPKYVGRPSASVERKGYP